LIATRIHSVWNVPTGRPSFLNQQKQHVVLMIVPLLRLRALVTRTAPATPPPPPSA
jgi:hypothetical protein